MNNQSEMIVRFPKGTYSDSVFESVSVHRTVAGNDGYIDPVIGNISLHKSDKLFAQIKNLDKTIGINDSPGWLTNLTPLVYNQTNLDKIYIGLFCIPDLHTRPLRNVTIPLEEPYRSHLRRLFISMDGYFESSNPLMDYDFIAKLVLEGPSGISKCKKIRLKSLVESKNGEMLTEPDWWNDYPSFKINEIGDVFNYHYLLDWEDPDSRDFELGRTPVKISQEHLEEFKTALARELPARSLFEKASPEEILLEQTSSTTLNPISMKGEKHWALQGSVSSFSNKGLTGLRTLIHTHVGTTRDTVILPIDQLNSVKLIDRQILSIIEHMRGNGMFRDPIKLEQKLAQDRKKFSYFINRDLKKEGITKPRELLHAIFEVLEDAYPDLEFEKYRHIYDSFTVITDSGEERMKRGHGLGMANSLTTMMQLIVFYMIQNRMIDEGFNNWSWVSCRAYNDDFYSAFKFEEDSYLYDDIEAEVFEDLSLMREPSKSHKGPYSVLCENYSPPLNTKESYARREILMSLACVNITQAKAYINSLDKSFNENLLDEYLDEIVAYWGYEFCPCERLQPASLGGWIGCTYRNVSDDCNHITECRHLKGLSQAGKINRIRVSKKMIRYKKIHYVSPIETLFNINELPNSEGESVFNLQDQKELNRKFFKISENETVVFRTWERLKEERQTEFGKWVKERTTPAEVEKDLIDTYPYIDFIPNWTALDNVVDGIYSTGLPVELTWEWQTISNPRLSYLKYHFPDKFNLRHDLSPTPIPLMMGGRGVPSLDFRADILYKSMHASPQGRRKLDTEAVNKCMIMTSNEAVNNSYLNPEAVLLFNALKTSVTRIPSHVGEKKRERIKLIKEFRFSEEELIRFWAIPYHLRLRLKLNFGNLMHEEFMIEELMKELYDDVPPEEERVAEPEEEIEMMTEEQRDHVEAIKTAFRLDFFGVKTQEDGSPITASYIEKNCIRVYRYDRADFNQLHKIWNRIHVLGASTARDHKAQFIELDRLRGEAEKLKHEIWTLEELEEDHVPEEFDMGAAFEDGMNDEFLDAFGGGW